MAELDVLALGRRAEADDPRLAEISADEGRITRLYLTPAHRRAADLVARMDEGSGPRGRGGRPRNGAWPPAPTREARGPTRRRAS